MRDLKHTWCVKLSVTSNVFHCSCHMYTCSVHTLQLQAVDRNFKTLREHIRQQSPPLVPCIPIILKGDWTPCMIYIPVCLSCDVCWHTVYVI